LALPDAFAESNERLRGQTQSIAMELQHHIIAFVSLNPQCISAVIDHLVAID